MHYNFQIDIKLFLESLLVCNLVMSLKKGYGLIVDLLKLKKLCNNIMKFK